MNYPGIEPIKTDLTLTGRILLECIHADTCLPCYWHGHNLPHIQIVVWNGMTLKEIKQELKTELMHGFVNGTDDAARLLNADYINPNEEKTADKLTAACYAAINRIKPNKKGQRKFFTDLEKFDEENEDLSESVYAYFVFRDKD